jgi:hypothetical protein
VRLQVESEHSRPRCTLITQDPREVPSILILYVLGTSNAVCLLLAARSNEVSPTGNMHHLVGARLVTGLLKSSPDSCSLRACGSRMDRILSHLYYLAHVLIR